MLVYEVIPCIYKFISSVSFFKTYSTGYFRKQENESGYFCGMTLVVIFQFFFCIFIDKNMDTNVFKNIVFSIKTYV